MSKEEQTGGDKGGAKAARARPKKGVPQKSAEQLAWEIARRDKMVARNQARPERPESVIVREGTKATIKSAKGQDQKLYAAEMMEALGTRSIPFLNDTLDNITRVMSPALNISADQHNAALAILASIEPVNELEATLGAQMVMANECSVRCMKAMVGTQVADHHKMYGDLANKFMRTFTAQVETLSRLRRGGEQVIKHVYVGEGGQAVFAKEIHNGGQKVGTAEQACGTGQFAECAALPGPDPARDGMPVPGDAKRKVSDSRGAIHGGAEG